MYNPHNTSFPEKSNDKKLKRIASNESLRRKLEALLLLECTEEAEQYFNLTARQIKEYKKTYFNIDPLISEGRAFVLDYLEERGDQDLLKYFIRGKAYTKGKLGFCVDLSEEEKKDLLSKAVSSTIIDTLDKNPDAMLSSRTISKLIDITKGDDDAASTEIDEVISIFKNKGYELYD